MIGNRLTPFKFWSQKVLPTVYDDSLSYYEVLNKVTEFLNEVIEQMNTLTQNVEDYEENLTGEWTSYKTELTAEWTAYKNELTAVWLEYKNYIDNYFANLDVQQEINNKLDQMATDGTLDALLLPYFNTYKTEIDGIVSTQNQKITVLEGRMDTFASLPDGSTSGDAELLDIRVGGNGITYPSAGDAVRAQYTILANKVEPIDDLPMTNIHNGVIKNGTDLLPIAVVYDDEYISGNVGNEIVHNSSNTFTAFKIEAKKGRYYFSNQARFTRTTDEDDIVLNVTDNVTTLNVTSDSAKFIYISVTDTNMVGFKIGYLEIPSDTKYVLKDLYNPVEPIIFGKGYSRATGDLSNGDTLTGIIANIRKNNIYSFTGKVTAFSSLLIGRGKTNNGASYVEITETQVIVHNYMGSDSTVTYTHGLTITDFITVNIFKKHDYATIYIGTNGGNWTQDEVVWSGDTYATSFVESVGSTLTECVFTWSSTDFRKSTWLFGDSYVGFTSANRWVYYLKNEGFLDSILLSGHAGQDSSTAWRAFLNCLRNYGQPKTIIWCLGMNDGSDSNSTTPSSTWSTGYDYVKQYCEAYGINLILATIPTVPNINHEGKNYVVRNSGYRYIDFAEAVGAQSNGTWYSGMLSSDNVHPTETGARALYERAIMDAPEITYFND